MQCFLQRTTVTSDTWLSRQLVVSKATTQLLQTKDRGVEPPSNVLAAYYLLLAVIR